MRTGLLLHSLAAFSLIAAPVAVAHATTYTVLPTLTDVTHPGDVTATFSSGPGAFSFNDPPTFSYDDTMTIVASDNSNNDELSLDLSFTAPGTGNASVTGDANIFGHRDVNGDIDWDFAGETVELSNGSFVNVSLPNFLGYPFSTPLFSCGDDHSCTCPSGDVCGATGVYITVLHNDPAPAPTPEPSSLALLGTGVLGVAGMMRRKLAL